MDHSEPTLAPSPSSTEKVEEVKSTPFHEGSGGCLDSSSRVEVPESKKGAMRDWDTSGGHVASSELYDAMLQAAEDATPEAVLSSLKESSLQIPPEQLEEYVRTHKVETYDLIEKKRLYSTVLRMALLRLAMKGVSARKASQILNCSWETAKNHYKDPLFRRAVFDKIKDAFGDIDEAFSDRAKTLHDLIQEQAERSFHDLVRLLEDPKLGHAHRIKINQDFLNRCEESQPMSKHTSQLDPTALMRASQVAREMEAAASGKLLSIEKPPEKREEKTG